MDILQRDSSRLSGVVANSRFAFLCLILAAFIIISLFIAMFGSPAQKMSLNAKNSFVTNLVGNPMVTNMNANIKGTVQQVDANSITLMSGTNIIHLPLSKDTLLVQASPPTPGKPPAVPVFGAFNPSSVKVGQEVQVGITIDSNGNPQTKTITIYTSENHAAGTSSVNIGTKLPLPPITPRKKSTIIPTKNP